MAQLFSGRFLSGHIRPDRSPLDVNGMAPPATDASPQRHQAGQLRLRSGIGRHHCNLRCYVYRAVDQHGQVIDVLVSKRRDGEAARRFFRRALATLTVRPTEVVTDAAPTYPRVLDELVPAAWHHVEQYANNRIEADHGRLKHRLDPCAGYAPTARLKSSSPGSPSYRISAAATTKTPSKPHARYRSPPRSPSWRTRSETGTGTASACPPNRQCNSALGRGGAAAGHARRVRRPDRRPVTPPNGRSPARRTSCSRRECSASALADR